MEGLTIGEITQVVQGRLIKGKQEAPVTRISIDSRTLQKGELFWALPGERFDGHDFIVPALEAGAAGVIFSRPETVSNVEASGHDQDHGIAFLWVQDPLSALQMLACHWRKRFPIPVVAVTGSNGKTTTKELIASVLATQMEVHKNEGNFNNLIGLPLTLLNLSSRHQASVLEMGMNRRGEIEALCQIGSPTIGVITNIGNAHLEILGSIEAIQQAKGELVQSLDKEHTLIVNADDPRVVELGKNFAGRRIDFGIYASAAVRASQIQEQGTEGVRFLLTIEDQSVPVCLRLMGRHNVSNALAAAAVGHAFSLDTEDIRKGLEGFAGMKMRMQLHPLQNNVLLINDAYNANPVSMEAAIRTLAGIAPQGRSFLVIGDMLELGTQTEALHRDIGKWVTELGIDYLITVGQLARLAAEESLHRKMDKDRVSICHSHQEATQVLLRWLREGDRVLIKGSRGSAMERVVQEILENQ